MTAKNDSLFSFKTHLLNSYLLHELPFVLGILLLYYYSKISKPNNKIAIACINVIFLLIPFLIAYIFSEINKEKNINAINVIKDITGVRLGAFLTSGAILVILPIFQIFKEITF